MLGGSLMVQQYVDEFGQGEHLRLLSISDIFTLTGRTKMVSNWDLNVRKIDDKMCEFTNSVHSSASPELMDFLGKQGIAWGNFKVTRIPVSVAHNQRAAPLFAKNTER
jgi:hypothetical protein